MNITPQDLMSNCIKVMFILILGKKWVHLCKGSGGHEDSMSKASVFNQL